MSFLALSRTLKGLKPPRQPFGLSTAGYRLNDSHTDAHTACTFRKQYATATIMQRESKDKEVEQSAVMYAKLDEPPLKVVGSQGSYIFTADGRKILDSTGGAAVACIGHNNKRVKEAINRQLGEISYCWAPLFTSEPVERLARQLCDSTDGQMSRAYIVSSGRVYLHLISHWHWLNRWIYRYGGG